MDFKSAEGNNKHTAKTKVINIFLCDMCLIIRLLEQSTRVWYGNAFTYSVKITYPK